MEAESIAEKLYNDALKFSESIENNKKLQNEVRGYIRSKKTGGNTVEIYRRIQEILTGGNDTEIIFTDTKELTSDLKKVGYSLETLDYLNKALDTEYNNPNSELKKIPTKMISDEKFEKYLSSCSQRDDVVIFGIRLHQYIPSTSLLNSKTSSDKETKTKSKSRIKELFYDGEIGIFGKTLAKPYRIYTLAEPGEE